VSDTWPPFPSFSSQPTLDAREPSRERQADLHAALEANVAAGNLPYYKVRIRTQGELIWIMQANKWSGEVEMGDNTRPDLRGADLRESDLSNQRVRPE
jgi:hypothetical protein